ncbi:hypothetical protein PRIPAC_83461 [Pristionchus pacificus]|nr:hypothetical protein PRIPAC_83461 [Pristionchus pacificus]|eukprot:PDM68639.1 ribosomal protein [Pristionchus pacificus]
MYPPNSNNVTAPNFELFNWRPEEEKAQSRAEGLGYPEQSQALAGRPLSVDRDEVIKRIAHFLKQTEKLRRGVQPNSYAKASGSVIRKALKSLETLKWSDKSEDGNGRVHSKQGRKDLDRIAAGLRSIDSLSSVRFALGAELRARINNFCPIAKKHTSSD